MTGLGMVASIGVDLFLSVGWEFSPLVTVGLSVTWKNVMTPETLTGMAPGSLG